MSAQTGIRAHDVQLDSIIITNYAETIQHDIKQIVGDVALEMGIYTKVIKGTITILDGIGLHTFLPIIGEETITIDFKSAGEDRTYRNMLFRVIGIRDFEFNSAYDSASYVLDIVSDEGLVNVARGGDVRHYVKSSNSFDLVDDIVKNWLLSNKDLSSQNESYATDVEIIYPNVSPFKAIDMICRRTYDADATKASNFYFWEDLDGFKFCNLHSCFDTTPVEYFFEVMETAGSGAGNLSRINEFFRIVSFEMPQKANTVRKINNGMVDSEYLRFNMVDKTLRFTQQTYRDQAESLKPIDKKYKLTNTDEFLYTYETDETDLGKPNMMNLVNYNVQESFTSFEKRSLSYSKSAAFVESLNQMELTIVVPGNTDLQPGHTIEINNFPKGTNVSKGPDKFDRYMNGKYLVTGLRHIFDQTKITTVLDIAKPTFNADIISIPVA